VPYSVSTAAADDKGGSSRADSNGESFDAKERWRLRPQHTAAKIATISTITTAGMTRKISESALVSVVVGSATVLPVRATVGATEGPAAAVDAIDTTVVVNDDDDNDELDSVAEIEKVENVSGDVAVGIVAVGFGVVRGAEEALDNAVVTRAVGHTHSLLTPLHKPGVVVALTAAHAQSNPDGRFSSLGQTPLRHVSATSQGPTAARHTMPVVVMAVYRHCPPRHVAEVRGEQNVFGQSFGRSHDCDRASLTMKMRSNASESEGA